MTETKRTTTVKLAVAQLVLAVVMVLAFTGLVVLLLVG